jgi:hypothetical protein
MGRSIFQKERDYRLRLNDLLLEYLSSLTTLADEPPTVYRLERLSTGLNFYNSLSLYITKPQFKKLKELELENELQSRISIAHHPRRRRHRRLHPTLGITPSLAPSHLSHPMDARQTLPTTATLDAMDRSGVLSLPPSDSTQKWVDPIANDPSKTHSDLFANFD